MELEIKQTGTKKINVFPCIKCGCDNIIIDDCGYSSFNIAYGKCTNKECKHEVQFGCGCDISKESIVNQWNAKNDPKLISAITGSEIGSGHWFNTLLANIKHTGEYLQSHGSPEPEVLKSWGEELYKRSDELLKWFEKLPSDVKARVNSTFTK